MYLVQAPWWSLYDQMKPVGENKASWQDLLLCAAHEYFLKKFDITALPFYVTRLKAQHKSGLTKY